MTSKLSSHFSKLVSVSYSLMFGDVKPCRKYFLHGLIFHRSRDLPLEREKVFSGTLKKGLSNGLTSGGVPQEHPISLTRQGGDNESTTE